MAKKKDAVGSFDFGFNVKPKKTTKAKARKPRKSGTGRRFNKWRDYISSPIPD
jgi:hypothetical protein